MEIELQAPILGQSDIDLLNKTLEKTILLLPGNYPTLNSYWETNGIPSLWQGTAPPRDPDWQTPPFSTAAPPASGNLTICNSTEPGSPLEAEESETEKKKEYWENMEIRERRLRLGPALEDAYRKGKILHFFSTRKAMELACRFGDRRET